jgi:branched-subunit amino acid ABC-type transport system permease component
MLISTAYKDAVGMVVLIAILLFMPSGLLARDSRAV